VQRNFCNAAVPMSVSENCGLKADCSLYDPNTADVDELCSMSGDSIQAIEPAAAVAAVAAIHTLPAAATVDQ